MPRPRYKIWARQKGSDGKAKVIAVLWPAKEGSPYPNNLDFQPKLEDAAWTKFDPQWDLDIRTVFEDPTNYFIDVRPVDGGGEEAKASTRTRRPPNRQPPVRKGPPPRRQAAQQVDEPAEEDYDEMDEPVDDPF